MQQNATRCHSEKNGFPSIARILLSRRQLSQTQQNAIPLLLQGLSDAQVAQQLNVDRTTLFRWRQDKNFATELEKQRQVLCRQSITRLQSMLEPALDILQKQITGDDPRTALRAASILLRVATPTRLARLANPDAPPHGHPNPGDAFERELTAYLNAPIPDDPAIDHDPEDDDPDESPP
jgi:transposase-like protein